MARGMKLVGLALALVACSGNGNRQTTRGIGSGERGDAAPDADEDESDTDIDETEDASPGPDDAVRVDLASAADYSALKRSKAIPLSFRLDSPWCQGNDYVRITQVEWQSDAPI